MVHGTANIKEIEEEYSPARGTNPDTELAFSGHFSGYFRGNKGKVSVERVF
jgi:hypothetical protein